ncbi:retrovirus-related pol polyprotein from transposon TNT 1-94 [Tanacetum coccineum]
MTMQVNVQFLQQLQPEWSRFVTIVKQQHKLDEVSYHKLFDILKQYQKEVNELRAERMAKNANPLALVATAQTLQDPYYQTSKPHKSYAPTSKASLPTRSHATTRYKGKEIAKPITPPSESASEEDSDPEQAQKDKDMQKNLALIAKYFKKLYKPTNNNLRTSSNTRNKNVDTTPRYKNDNQTGQFGNQRAVNVVGARETVGGPVVQQSGIQCFNCKEFGHYAKECRKPKRVKDSTYHKEKMLLCKQAEKGVQLQAEQSDWLADTDEEIDEQELEAHYSYMAKIQEVPNADSGTDAEPLEQVQYDTDDNVFANDIQHFDQSESISNTCAVETGDSNVTPDSPDMCDNDIQDDQNDVECDDERVALANLIANLKLDVDENKKIQKQLKKANATLTQELTECKSILAETSRTLGESNIDYDKLERRLNETLGLLAQKEIDIKEGLKVKAYEISVVKEKHDELVKQSLLTKSHYEGLVKEKTKVITDLKLKEEKDIDKMISMENQLKFLNEIVYKRSQSIQTIHMLAPKCPTFNGRPTFANPRYLKKAQNEIPCLYAIPHDQSDPANRLVPDREETLTLENESRSKLNKDLVKPFDYTKLNSLYEIFKPPTQHYEIQFAQANEIRKKMWRKSFVKTKPNIFKNIDFLPVSKSISKSRQAYNVMTNNINHLKEIVNQAWVKHSNDLLHLRNPTAQDMEILVKTCLMPLALKTQNDSFAFVHELKQEMHADLKYVESLEDELDELESDKAEFSNMYDMLLQECVSKDVMCSYLQSSSDLDEITELQCLYLHKVRECDCLAQKLSEQTEFVSKEIYTELLQSFAKLEKHSISLEIALQECQEQLKNDTVCKEKASNVFRKEREQYFEIQDLKAQLQDKNIAISELKKLIEKCKGKSVDTKFDKPSVVRQPNAQRIPKPSVLGKPAPFSDSLERKYFAKKKSVLKTNESEGLSKPVTPQNLPQTAKQAVRNTNVIKPGMYRIASSTTQTRAPQLNQTSRNTNPRVSTSIGVAHKTNVSRPQPRSNQMKDKVVSNTSHVKFKKTKVEEQPRISSISNKTKSVTACNDSLNSRTSNANAVCATCGKCVFNLNHDACVSKFLNDVNARTKKPNVVPISTRKPKRQANKSVATPHKKTVASESTTTSSKSYYRMLYQKTSKAWKWWIAQQCPSSYTWVPKTQKKWVPRTQKKWVPKTQKQWVPKTRNESVPKRVSFAIDNTSRITNVLKLTNTLGSNLSCVPSSSTSLADCTTHPIHC